MAGLRTEFPFTLPKGYVAGDGVLHRQGVMRLATARDEIEPLRDRSIDGPDDPYLTILVLARVVTELGSLPSVGTAEVEGLFAADLAFLQDLYGIINFGDQDEVAALQASVLPDDDLDDQFGDGAGAIEAEVVAAEVVETDVVDVGGSVGSDAASSARNDFGAARRRGRIEEVSSPGHG